MKNIFRVFAIISFFCLSVAQAETEMNRAKTFQNPLGVNPEVRYFTLPFVNYTNFGYGANKNTQNIFDLKPVMPFHFTNSLDFIIRTIAPITHQPVTSGYANGLGDINPTVFISPSANSLLLWGVGPTFILPTATNKNLGAGKWSVGPELVLISMPDQWTFAILTNNVWSLAGQSNRPSVSEFTFQYFITYNFSHGWYVSTQPSLTANWHAQSDQIWTVPFGGGAGRSFHVGSQAMNFLLQGYYNAVRPSTGAPWTLQISLEFLFDDKRGLVTEQRSF